MSEAEESDKSKKGSTWPWILVPVAAISMFFVLRYCQQHVPPAEQAHPADATPAAPASQ
jgi:uncharacterized membrane-anchored protein